jgi:hypothetical protein
VAGFYHTVCITGAWQRHEPSLAPSTLGQDFATLVNNPIRSDVEFIVEGMPIYAHRCILMARCAPLEVMLGGPMRESAETRIVIPDHFV